MNSYGKVAVSLATYLIAKRNPASRLLLLIPVAELAYEFAKGLRGPAIIEGRHEVI